MIRISGRKNKDTQKKFEQYVPKHLHPKILLVDMDSDDEDALKSEGYHIKSGSFGIPYIVEKSDKFEPVIMDGTLPNYTEQEIVVIDLVPDKPVDKPNNGKQTSLGENDWWASCKDGQIDPRPRVMANVKTAFNRILSHGGSFIVFADPRYLQKMEWGHIDSIYGRLIFLLK